MVKVVSTAAVPNLELYLEFYGWGLCKEEDKPIDNVRAKHRRIWQRRKHKRKSRRKADRVDGK